MAANEVKEKKQCFVRLLHSCERGRERVKHVFFLGREIVKPNECAFFTLPDCALGGSGCGACEVVLVVISLIMSIIAVSSGKDMF